MCVSVPVEIDTDDVMSRLGDVIAMRDAAGEQCRQRAARLQEALRVAERFHGEITEISAEMHRIRDLAVRSHEIPVINADIVRQQLKDLQVTGAADYTVFFSTPIFSVVFFHVSCRD
jgi:hypothetical protein